jgi:hypothetical protein
MTGVPRLPRQGARLLEGENDMTRTVAGRRRPAIGLGLMDLRGQWTGSLDAYRQVTEQYGITLGGAQ